MLFETAPNFHAQLLSRVGKLNFNSSILGNLIIGSFVTLIPFSSFLGTMF